MAELALLTAVEQARLVRTRKASAVEVVDAVLRRIDRLNKKVNAFITVTPDDARTEASAADRAVAESRALGPLHGVPVSLKDNIKTKGIRTTAGSRLLENHVPDHDATVVERLRTAGAIIVGKTHLSEFAWGAPQFGEIRNPWNLAYSPGGSSAGAGAAAAAGMGAIAIGHDTGGSVRIPASLCGVVGVLGTYGRVSRHGVIPLTWSFDHVGPLTRTVADAALALSVIAGHDPRDPHSSPVEAGDFSSSLGGGLAGLRAGIPREWCFEDADPEVKQAVLGALPVLQALGMTITDISVPLVQHWKEIQMPIVWAEAEAYHERDIDESPAKYGPGLLQYLRAARVITAKAYLKAQRLREALRRQFLEVFQAVDVLITPTTRVPAPALEQHTARTVGTDPFEGARLLAGLTIPFTQARLPAMSVPCGFTKAGLPIGMQIVGRPWQERTMLRVADAFQQETQWHVGLPSL